MTVNFHLRFLPAGFSAVKTSPRYANHPSHTHSPDIEHHLEHQFSLPLDECSTVQGMQRLVLYSMRKTYAFYYYYYYYYYYYFIHEMPVNFPHIYELL